MNYIKELDSLRAIAVLIVITHHWKPGRLTVFSDVLDGVAIFFVLSGFLITSILLRYREKLDKSEINRKSAFKTFFARRSLRIFPLYYFVLFFLFVTGQQPQGWVYYLTYTSNFYIFNTQEWNNVTHFWSLAVEEQFYLIWPLIILLLSRKYILPVILSAVLIGFISPLFIVPHTEFKYILTPTCFSAIGLGALLSWINLYRARVFKKYYGIITLAGVISLLLLIIRIPIDLGAIVNIRVLTSILTFCVIIYILKTKQEKNWVLSYILRNNMLVFIGKISYGLYVYHNIIPLYTIDFLNNLNRFLPNKLLVFNRSILFLENFIILVLIAYISWHFIERPFLKLKKYFRYDDEILKSASTSKKVLSSGA